MFHRKQKVFLSIILLAHLFIMSALPVSAGLFGGGIKIPSASSFLSDAERRYHIDSQSLQGQGESLNTSDGKRPTPAVSIFFSPTDPKEGEKLSAKAFPMYFTNTEKTLYYTWYLKRAQCNLGNNLAAVALCDQNGDRRVTVEDWKIEAALILSQNGFDKADANYASDIDNDEYKARFGGDNKIGVPDHCYYNDPATGKNYELGRSTNINFDCPNGQIPVCLQGEGRVDPIDITIPGSDPWNGTGSTTGPAFGSSDTGVCMVSGYPYCSANGVPRCTSGTPRCVANTSANPLDCGVALNSCSGGGNNAFNPVCDHLFPNAPGFFSATRNDGFGANEERFWGTSPQDPSTANNGNKDEANVVGLGQNNLTWNYVAGDQIGVVVEGTSMIGTKYADSSSMIMWAFSKGDCPINKGGRSGSFYRQIKGYQVEMPSIEFDFNECLPGNLIDPTEGGQATNLDISVSATPETPINDETPDAGGDTMLAQATVANAAKDVSDIVFEWDVDLSNNPQFKNDGGAFLSKKVTSDLQSLKLLGAVKGTALDAIQIKLDIPNNAATLLAGHRLAEYLNADGIAYVRFTAKASENFKSGAIRKGKSDVIAKFVSTSKKISVYKPVPQLVGTSMQVALPGPLPPGLICNDDPLDRIACRIVKNEVIGLRIDPTDLTNFQWLINGTPLTCNRAVVSQDCEKNSVGAITLGEQNFVNFFPVSGETGDTYTVTVNANDIKTGKTVSLARSFHVIDPELYLKSADLGTAWPKLVGQYKDVDGTASIACPSGFCNDYSNSVFEGFATQALSFKSAFIPNFLAPRALRQWTVDGVLIDDVPSVNAQGVTEYTITFDALKAAPDVYNITLSASISQSPELRRALRDIWNISPLESTETRFSASSQVQLKEPGFAQGTLQGTKKYLAALSSYIPSSVMFSFRIFLSVLLILFTARFFLTLLPETINFSGAPRRRG